MTRSVISILLVLLSATFVLGQDATAPPDSSIVFGVASVTDDEQIVIRYSAMAPAIPVTEAVEQAYTVMVPYTEEVEKDGVKKEVQKMRSETRTRTINVARMHRVTETTYKLSECRLQDVSGSELPLMNTLELLQQDRPVVTIRPGAELNEYYLALLRDDVIVIVCPEPKIELTPPAGTEPAK